MTKLVRFNFFLCSIPLLFQFGIVSAQTKHCDKLLHQGDTIVCQDLKRGRLFKEHFYLEGERIFTRRWRYQSNGTFAYYQKKKAGFFALTDGPEVHFYPNGNVQYYLTYVRGRRVGPCFAYYPSGALKHICDVNDKGQFNGVLAEFHENGQVYSEALWENGRLREILKHQDDKGQALPVGTFKAGNGTLIWHENGRPAFLFTYRNGKRIRTRPYTDPN